MPLLACGSLPVKSKIRRSPTLRKTRLTFQLSSASMALVSFQTPSGISAMRFLRTSSACWIIFLVTASINSGPYCENISWIRDFATLLAAVSHLRSRPTIVGLDHVDDHQKEVF